jgi:RNA polymerase sigma-70 factor (ECF subfamily)
VSAVEIAAPDLDRSLAVTAETRRPVEARAMENREFDYDRLVRPMEPRMMRSIWRIVRQREAAEDALQDALAVIWRKRDTVARHPNSQALILRITVAAAYDAVRKSRRRLRHEIPGLPDQAADDSAVPVTKGTEDRSLRTAILEAIGRLPKRQATAVLLHIVEEQSYEEIARAMDRSETTVRVHVMRARGALARRLAHLHPDLVQGFEGTRKEAVP